jgi:hypothetical protein
MSNKNIALKEGCIKYSILFEKPINVAVIRYLAKMRWCAHKRHSRTLEEIGKAMRKEADLDPEEVTPGIIANLVISEWIKRVDKKTGGLPEYEITPQGSALAKHLKDPVISVLFKP